jgi:hypothetical protein
VERGVGREDAGLDVEEEEGEVLQGVSKDGFTSSTLERLGTREITSSMHPGVKSVQIGGFDNLLA